MNRLETRLRKVERTIQSLSDSRQVRRRFEETARFFAEAETNRIVMAVWERAGDRSVVDALRDDPEFNRYAAGYFATRPGVTSP